MPILSTKEDEWNEMPDEFILSSYEFALKCVAMSNRVNADAFDVRKAKFYQRKLDKFILPQVERRGLVEFHG